MKKIAIILFALLGCTNDNDNINYINLSSDDKSIDFSKYVDSVSIVKMEQKQGYYLNNYQTSFYVKDSLIYFIDQEQKKIYSFSINGNAINKFDKIGNAKDEYIDIEDFTLFNDKIYVLCFPYKLFILNRQLEIEEIRKLDYNFKRIKCYNNYLYMYSHDDRALFRYNTSNNTVEQILIDKRKENPVSFYPQPVLSFVSDSLLLINMVGSDILYSINQNNNIESKYTLHYEDKEFLYNKTADIQLYDVINQMKYAKPSIENIIKGKQNTYIIYSFKALYRLVVIDNYSNVMIDEGIIKNTIQNKIPHGDKYGNLYSTVYVNNEDILHMSEYKCGILPSIENDESLIMCTYYIK